MTQLFKCDECGRILVDDEYRIELDVVDPIIESDESVDGLQPMVSTLHVGFVANTHFCSMACLREWAAHLAVT